VSRRQLRGRRGDRHRRTAQRDHGVRGACLSVTAINVQADPARIARIDVRAVTG
jgi:hypothetical protein